MEIDVYEQHPNMGALIQRVREYLWFGIQVDGIMPLWETTEHWGCLGVVVTEEVDEENTILHHLIAMDTAAEGGATVAAVLASPGWQDLYAVQSTVPLGNPVNAAACVQEICLVKEQLLAEACAATVPYGVVFADTFANSVAGLVGAVQVAQGPAQSLISLEQWCISLVPEGGDVHHRAWPNTPYGQTVRVMEKADVSGIVSALKDIAGRDVQFQANYKGTLVTFGSRTMMP